MKRTLNARNSAVLEVLSKPKTFTELRNQIGLRKGNNISTILKELVNQNLIYCMKPRATVGKLYSLTNRGRKFRKRLLNIKKLKYQYVHPSDINWNLYAWIVCGRQRRAILKGLSIAMPLKYVRERAHQYDTKISRMNCHDILELFVKKGLARKISHGKRIHYALTKKGERIRNQLLEP